MNDIRRLVYDSILVSILVVIKEALSFIPNVELVTLLFMVYALNMRIFDLLLISFVFSLIENILYGFNIYSLCYFVVWGIIVCVSYLFRYKLTDEYKVATLSLTFGLLFDIPFSIPYFLLGINVGISYLLSGLLFTLVHGISNFIVALLLFKPINSSFKKLCQFK